MTTTPRRSKPAPLAPPPTKRGLGGGSGGRTPSQEARLPTSPLASNVLRPFILLSSILLLTACARPKGALFESAADAPAWPSDNPRIRYLGQLQTDRDLKPARHTAKGLGEFLFGKEDSHAMLSPIGVCTDRTRTFVADSNGQIVHVFNLDSREYQQWKPSPEQPAFSMPVALAATPDGHLLVADSVQAIIFEFDPVGNCLRTLGLGILKRPCGIAIEPATGHIFVADALAHQIVILSRDGAELSRIGRRGSQPGEFNFPTQLAFDTQGRLYISDTLNFRVQVFSSDLKPLRQIGVKGDRPGYFSQPKGLAVDNDNNLYVVDANFESVQVFDQQGQLLLAFGHEGHAPGEFWLPAGLCIDPSGRIWVADTYNKRVQIFQYVPVPQDLREGHTP